MQVQGGVGAGYCGTYLSANLSANMQRNSFSGVMSTSLCIGVLWRLLHAEPNGGGC